MFKSEKLVRLKRNMKIPKRDLKKFEVGKILKDQIAIEAGKHSKLHYYFFKCIK